jgi:hypothetical protein
MTSSSTALLLPTLAEGGARCLHLVEPARREWTPKGGDARAPARECVARAQREEAIQEIAMLSGFQAEVFDPVLRRWVAGFAIHSEFPKPSAKSLHAAALRRRGFANEKVADVLHVRTKRVSILAWRGEGFLMCVEGTAGHEEARLAARCRL